MYTLKYETCIMFTCFYYVSTVDIGDFPSVYCFGEFSKRCCYPSCIRATVVVYSNVLLCEIFVI